MDSISCVNCNGFSSNIHNNEIGYYCLIYQKIIPNYIIFKEAGRLRPCWCKYNGFNPSNETNRKYFKR